MEHMPSANRYHKPEILYEEYLEEQFRKKFKYMLHTYFDGSKKYGLKYVKENLVALCLKKSNMS